MQSVTFDISGMTCGGCSMRVQHALAKLDGVGKAEVTLRPGGVTVEMDLKRVTATQIVSAIAKVGFVATPI
jgi:copper chaperone